MKEINWLKNELIAHRGFHSNNEYIYENSLSAIKKALDYNYAIEMDIQLTLDDELVVFHDRTFKRLCGDDRYVSKTSYKDIQKIYFKNTLEHPPLFKDVLKTVSGKKPLLIELKSFKNYKNLVDITIKELNDYTGLFALFSFDFRIVNYLKKKYPHIYRGQITSYFNDDKMNFILKFIMKTMIFNAFSKPHFISYDAKYLPNKYANKCLDKNMIVISYTARNQEVFNKVREKYHNIVFEDFHPNIEKIKSL